VRRNCRQCGWIYAFYHWGGIGCDDCPVNSPGNQQDMLPLVTWPFGGKIGEGGKGLVVPQERGNYEPVPRDHMHYGRDEWSDKPAPYQPGWILTTCLKCDGYIGQRPVEKQKPKKRKRKQNGSH